MNKLLFALCILFTGFNLFAADQEAKSKLHTEKKKSSQKDSHLSTPTKGQDYSPADTHKSRGRKNFQNKDKHYKLPKSAQRLF